MSQPTRNCPTCHTPLPGMAAFCYVCGTATPSGIDRATGQRVAMGGNSGITSDELVLRLQRALGPGYQMEHRVGQGGFAVVFKVRDLRLKRDLAVKVLRPDLGLSADILQRFRREAETIAALRHGNIVPVYDVGEAEGLAFLIMPLIEGESLRAAMEREGAMPADEVRRILKETSLGLAAAHDAGMIHRDIKPENIMLEGKNRHALLMDFGIAKAVSREDGDPGEALTTTGIIIGTPQYMSPEQATGDKNIDARTDQYSLAVVGYRMLSGRLPFEGESTRAVLYQQLVAEPQPLEIHIPNVPISLAATIKRAMAKEPAERFDTMRDFAAALEDGHSIKMPAKLAAKAKQRSPALLGGIALAALAVIVIAAKLIGGGSTPPVVPPALSGDSGVLVGDAGTGGLAPGGTAVVAPPPPPPPATAVKPTAKPPVKGDKNIPVAPTPSSAGAASSVAPTTPRPPTASSCIKAVGAADWPTAVTSCTTEGDAGNAVAQRILGGMYDKGTGVPENPTKAYEWYRKASATDPESKFRIAGMLEDGRGVKKNSAEGGALLREAAAAGYQPAQQLLAYRLEIGSNIKKDEAEAAVWYRRLAESGERQAQEKLAEFLVKGRGVTKNEAEGLTWYKKAADNGVLNAAWQAAQMYFKGQGTPKDETQGMIWLRKAAAGNQPDAVKELQKRGG